MPPPVEREPPGLVGLTLGDGGEADDAAGADFKELARSYGLHLLPDSGQILQDNLSAVLHAPPPPPELRGGSYTSHSPKKPNGRGGAAGGELGGSPSLPMLSPGRPGARNWVTFLHGGGMAGF